MRGLPPGGNQSNVFPILAEHRDTHFGGLSVLVVGWPLVSNTGKHVYPLSGPYVICDGVWKRFLMRATMILLRRPHGTVQHAKKGRASNPGIRRVRGNRDTRARLLQLWTQRAVSGGVEPGSARARKSSLRKGYQTTCFSTVVHS